VDITFYATYDIQRSAIENVYQELLRRGYQCEWRVGTDLELGSKKAGVMCAHATRYPNLFRTKPQYFFYFPHDVTEYDVQPVPSPYDVVFCPGSLWARHIRKARRGVGRLEIVGWPKFDTTRTKPEMQEIITSMPHDFTVYYTPSWERGDGLTLVDMFRDLPYNLIIKYRDAPGKAEDREGIPKVEKLAETVPNVKVIPAPWDFLAIAPFADMLIADTSSTLVEFLPFGKSIQLSKKPKSRYVERVRINTLYRYLKKMNLKKIKAYRKQKAVDAYFLRMDKCASKRTADIIEEYVHKG